MITLITGGIGSGKTAFAVSKLLHQMDGEYAGRKVFVFGIDGLLIDTCPVPDGHDVMDMQDWLTDAEYQGSLVIIDEAQYIFPPRSQSAPKSPLIEWLHKSRHDGIDFILITQMPMRIDKQVRDLVNHHFHIRKTPLGVRVIYYWDYCNSNPNSARKTAKISHYKLDKKAFSYYKSADVHTENKTPKSRLLYVIPIAFVAFVFFAYNSYKLISGQSDKTTDDNRPTTSVSQTVEHGINGVSSNITANANGISTPNKLTADMLQPTIETMPESKPLYDTVRQVKTFEFPSACVSGGKSGCTCYTSQGTAIKEIDKKLCLTYVSDGLPFNPYKDNQPQQVQAVQPVSVS